MFSSRCFKVASVISILMTGAAGALSAADKLPAQTAAYSARQSVDAGGEVIEGKLFRDGEKMRMENDEGGTMILDPVNRQMLMMMQGMPMAMAMPVNPTEDWGGEEGLAHCQVKAGRQARIEGEATTVYTIDCPAKDKEAPWKGELAVTADGIPMEMEIETVEDGKKIGVRSKLTEVKRGPQPAALFKLPTGVQVQTMPGMPAMPGGR